MIRVLSAAGLAFMIAGCVSAPEKPNGCVALQTGLPGVTTTGTACAIQLNKHWAVSAKHADSILTFTKTVRSPRYDILFFRHEGEAPRWSTQANPGATSTAAGNPWNPLDLLGVPIPGRVDAKTIILSTNYQYCGTRSTPAMCTLAIVFKGDVGHGYSGGPLIDGAGAVIGMVVAGGEANKDYPPWINKGETFGIALPSSLILSEFEELVPKEERERGKEEAK